MAGQSTPSLRWIRCGLIVAVNGYFAYSQIAEILATRAARRVDPVVNFDTGPPTTSDYLFIGPLILGIVLEFVSWRWARIVNVGYYAVLALYTPVGLVFASYGLFGFDLPEHWAEAVVFVAVPSAMFATLLWGLYRRTRANPNAPS